MDELLKNKTFKVFFDDGSQGRVGLKTGTLVDITDSFVVLRLVESEFLEVIPLSKIFRMCEWKTGNRGY